MISIARNGRDIAAIGWICIPRRRKCTPLRYREHGTRRIVAIVKDRVNNTLDIGCGIGDLVRLFATKSEMVFGIDIADANVQLARRNLLRDQLLNTVIVQGSAESLAFSADSFDVVIIADVIEHVRDINAALTEIARVLRPGGLLICVTAARGNPKSLGRL